MPSVATKDAPGKKIVIRARQSQAKFDLDLLSLSGMSVTIRR